MGGAGLGDLLEGDHVGDGVAAAAAVGFGDGDPHEPQLPHPADGVVGEAGLVVDGGRDGTDLLVGELPRHRLDHPLLVTQLDVHGSYFSNSFLNSAVRSGATSKRSPTIP